MSYNSVSSAYVIMINDDNTMTTTQKRRIVQTSKLVDDLCFLVNPIYNGYYMKDFTVILEYTMPVSKECCNESLTLSDETYQGYLKYILPVDTQLTEEAGRIEIKLTFSCVDPDEPGGSVQRVRNITSTFIDVVPNIAYDDVIPDSSLNVLNQRIIELDAKVKALNETIAIMEDTKADDLYCNNDTNELQLMSGDKLIGTKVVISAVCDAENSAISDIEIDNICGGLDENIILASNDAEELLAMLI